MSRDVSRYGVAAAAAGVAALALAACGETGADSAESLDADGAEDGWTLAAFDHYGEGEWSEEDGVIYGTGEVPQNVIVTPGEYEDVAISVEFWISEGGNSGVFFRCEDPANVTDQTCYEANIFDDRPDQSGRTGAIVNIAPPEVEIDADGQWNTYDIRIEGDRITVVLNGETTVDTTDGTHAGAGHIALQAGPGEARFRNIRIEEL